MGLKKNVLILCGGRSPEHKISLLSAQNVIKSLDNEIYEAILVGITPEGDWYYYKESLDLENKANPKEIKLIPSESKVLLSPNNSDKALYDAGSGDKIADIDVAFPVIHGNSGEDGSIQGLFQLAGIPIVGCDIDGSVLCMDKDLMKKVLRDANIAVAPSITIRPHTKKENNYTQVTKLLGDTLYIKPASLGSSLGVACVSNAAEYDEALDMALSYCNKVLIESRIIGREIECAVLGNSFPAASTIGEIVPQVDFYTFENKYVNADGALLVIPAELSEEVMQRAQKLAIDTFLALDCCGLSRVDMFYKENGDLLINEVNTMPGFTNISMYPKLWEHGGISQQELLTRLIKLGIERYENIDRLNHV